MSRGEAYQKHSTKGRRVKNLPSMLVLVRKPLGGQMGGWVPKARICVCGNFENDTVGNDLSNRAEVPTTFELKTMLSLGTEKGWSIGSLDIHTAFLYAELCEDDGIT